MWSGLRGILNHRVVSPSFRLPAPTEPSSPSSSASGPLYFVYPYAFLLIEAHFPFCTLVLIRFRAEKAVSSFHEWRIPTFKIAPHFIKTIYFFRLRLNTRECKLLPKKPSNTFSLASTSLLPVMPLQMHLTPIRIEPSYPLLIDVFIDYRCFCHRLRRSRKTVPNLLFEIEGGFSRGDIIPDRI